ncbi:MAG: tRNA guanosine(34) transglycosylase Tgt [Synergistaceae bacterium]|nr:tRNA guanosine(34) transglycosylase Tgt [Synergistaceae bacterium]
MFEFKLEAVCGRARAGEFATPHGIIKTPVFMPVGTQASVKAMSPDELEDINAQIILGNTYHLYLRPSDELIAEAGGLHKFMNWRRPILTDSGGFQVFSLAKLNKISDEGVSCRSHIDGSEHFMSPEWSMKVQENLGSDIAMCFDQCGAYPATHERAEEELKRTSLWALRCKNSHKREDQALFGIVQGSFYEDLRLRSAREIIDLDFNGYGIGGLSVGEPREVMYNMLDVLNPVMPEHKPRYLMGVGYPADIVEGIARGIDMFDCVMPTRNGRNGTLFTQFGRVNIKANCYARDFRPVDETCGCYLCRNFSRAYLRHLYQAGEILAARLCTYHNLYFTIKLAERARQAIIDNRFNEFREDFYAKFKDERA